MPKQANATDVQKGKELKKELLSSKIDLGRDPNQYSTTYKAEHDDKGYCRDSGTSQSIMKDLRSTHYKLGFQKVQFDNRRDRLTASTRQTS